MRIETVTLKNFCQHQFREDVLGPGVIGIMGRNGSGKSNYLKGIKRALTGDSGNAGKKEEDIGWGADAGSVRIAFSVNGQPGSIHRNLGSTSCKMEFGGQVYKTATTIDQVIYNILGVPAKVLSDMVFVSQGQIEGILFQKPSERARALQTLFGTDAAERIREVIFEELQVAVVNSRMEAINKLETQLKVDVQKPLADAEAELAKILLLSDEERKTRSELVLRYESYVRAFTQANTSKADADRYATELATTELELMQAEKAARDSLATLTELRVLYEQAKQQLNAAAAAKVSIARRQQLESRLVTLQTSAQEPKPVEPPPLPVINIERMQTLQAEIRDSQRILQAVGQTKECPTCQQPINEQHVVAHRVKMENATAELKPLAEAYSAYQVAERKLKDWETAVFLWSNRQKAVGQETQHVQQELASLKVAAIPSESELADARGLIADFEALQRLETEQRIAVSSVRAKRDQLNSSAILAKSRAEQAQAALGDAVSDADYNAAKNLLEGNEKAAKRAAELQGKCSVLTKTREDLTRQVQEYRAEEAKLGRIKLWREQLERTRSILHRDQLPNLVAQSFVKALNAKLSVYLDMFEVPYSARIQPDLSIECVFPGDRKVPSERLSGGEKVMLGIAFRFAVYDLFVSNLGLLILDEPTVYLDDDRVDSVFALLERVKSYSKSAGLQLIVVTHEQRLAGVFDKVIRL